MKHALILIAGLLSLQAGAADLSFSGQAVNHNDKIVIDFQATAGSTVSLWTDSWQSGLNFDPQLFLAQGDTIVLTDNDGGSLVNAGAGYFDAGLQFTAAATGSYRLVLNASSNDALGTLLSQGFTYDSQAPIPLATWNQPGYDVNANDQKGGFWRVNLSGVETAAVVPEPAHWALLLPGLLGVALAARRRR
ncbi:MAG: PEP-CTERM sorting domain-containing protein [Burkholderiales bacterium]|nr:MAG: PEP-CTERM sorting domain-containing protein [Burkholderiales bacterium]